jgi:hypothetical protein
VRCRSVAGDPEAEGRTGYFLPAFFLPATVLLGALAGARVGVRALTADRQAATVPQTLVAADLDLAADVGGDLAAEVTLDLVVALDPVAELDQLVVAQVLDAQVGADAGGGQGLAGRGCGRCRRCR